MFNLTPTDEEPRESRSIKIKPSILRNAHHMAIEEGCRSLAYSVEARWEVSDEVLDRIEAFSRGRSQHL